MPDSTQLLDAGGWRGSPSSRSHFDQSLGLGPIFPLLTLLIALVLDVLLRTIHPCCHSQQGCHDRCIRDQHIYITSGTAYKLSDATYQSLVAHPCGTSPASTSTFLLVDLHAA